MSSETLEPSVGERRARLMALAEAQRLQLHADMHRILSAASARIETPLRKARVPAALALGVALFTLALRRRRHKTEPTRRERIREANAEQSRKHGLIGGLIGALPVALLWMQRARSLAHAYTTFRGMVPHRAPPGARVPPPRPVA